MRGELFVILAVLLSVLTICSVIIMAQGKVSITENAVLGDEELMKGLRALNPEFGDYCIRVSGEAWGKPLIDQKTKTLIAIVVDIVEQIHGLPFENHVKMAVKQGVTREELEELLFFMTVYAGFNKAGGYYGPLKGLFDQTE